MKLNKHDKRIVSLINTVTSNSEYHSMHKPRHRGKDIKYIFWWDVVYGSIWAKYFRYTMPKIFRALDKLFPVLIYDCNYDGIKHENSFGYNQNNIEIP